MAKMPTAVANWIAHPLHVAFALSFLALYFELVTIRWLSSEVQVFAWLKNLPLMAAFLGLGLGALAPSASSRLGPWFAWLFAALAALLVGAGRLQLDRIAFPDPSITTWHAPDPTATAWYESFGEVARAAAFLVVVLVVLALVVALFTVVGRALGAAMNESRPLPAYTANILGSLGGVLAFTLLSFLETPPFVWVLVGLGAALLLLPRRRTVGVAVALTLAVTLVYGMRSDVLWSPYYRVGYAPIAGAEPPVGYTNHGQSPLPPAGREPFR